MQLRASMLESFRLFQAEDWMTAERFISQITADEETHAMKLGTAFHAMLENPPELVDPGTDHERYESGGYCFDPISFDEHTGHLRLLNIMPEVYAEMDIGGHVLTGHTDGIEGLTIHEYKTTEKPIDTMKYVESIQWQCYLELFGCEKVSYHVFRLDNKQGDYRVIDYQSVDLYRYAAMRENIERLVREFAGFLDYHNIRLNAA